MKSKYSLTINGMAAAGLACLIAACGGGGGSASDTVSASTASLIPDAAPLGAMLYADATQLRPVRAGAVWSYHGTESYTGQLRVPTVYTDVVQHQAGSGIAVSEQASNAYNAGTDQSTVSILNGEVHSLSQLDIGNGQPVIIDEIELRSPVRVNDQYTVLDQHINNSGVDVDGDGKADAVDLAIYKLVVGSESVDLPSYPQAPTVHVRTVLLIRFRLSTTGAYSSVVTSNLDTWYSPGLGVVKRAEDIPSFDPSLGRHVMQETLVTWDGVTEGLGSLEPKAANLLSGEPLQYVGDGVGFGTHALLLSSAGSNATSGIALSSVDSRGNVTSTQTYPGINAWDAQMVQVGTGVRVVSLTNSGLVGYAFDSTGTASLPTSAVLVPPPVATNTSTQTFAIASTGTTLWVAWFEPTSDAWGNGTSPRLLLQGFDVNFQPIGSPTVLNASVADINSLQPSSAAGHAIFTWNEHQGLIGDAKRYALIEGDGAVVPTIHTALPAADPQAYGTAIASTAGSALLWLSPRPGATGQGVYGVTFDGTGEPLRSNTGDVGTEYLPLNWLNNVQLLSTAGGGATLDTVQVDSGKLWPDDQVDGLLTQVTELKAGNGPLATQGQPRLLARGTFSAPTLVVSLQGTILLISSNGTGTTITPVWRRH